MPQWNHVPGKKIRDVKLYALSTCGHCKKTKDFLSEAEIAYDYIFVDLLNQDELEEIYSGMKKYNPRGSFPTIIIDEKDVIVGSRIDDLKTALGLK